MTLAHLLPIAVAAVALFFASFLSWMVLQLHKQDWKKIDREAEFMAAVGAFNLPEGSYLFPMADNPKEMQTPEFQAKYAAGPRGILSLYPKANMGANLGLTFLYFLIVSFILGYLASIAFQPGAEFLQVFRFVFAAGLPMFLGAILSHAIWFRMRVTGQVIESIAYAAITALIFASLWPPGA
jgi:hypothetical protein